MRIVLSVLAACFMAVFCNISAASAAIVDVDLSNQVMHVHSASGDYNWPISSARSGYVTPRGYYRAQRLERMHYSRKYHNSPMPHSIFFRGGYAIHGTGSVSQLGRPASHGCIRLAPAHAEALYNMVRAEGAQIRISGSPPGTYASRHHHGQGYYAAVGTRALGYAQPRRHLVSVRRWQQNPASWY